MATGVPKPAAPSMNVPNEKAINSACMRRSGEIAATERLTTSNWPGAHREMKQEHGGQHDPADRQQSEARAVQRPRPARPAGMPNPQHRHGQRHGQADHRRARRRLADDQQPQQHHDRRRRQQRRQPGRAQRIVDLHPVHRARSRTLR